MSGKYIFALISFFILKLKKYLKGFFVAKKGFPIWQNINLRVVGRIGRRRRRRPLLVPMVDLRRQPLQHIVHRPLERVRTVVVVKAAVVIVVVFDVGTGGAAPRRAPPLMLPGGAVDALRLRRRRLVLQGVVDLAGRRRRRLVEGRRVVG